MTIEAPTGAFNSGSTRPGMRVASIQPFWAPFGPRGRHVRHLGLDGPASSSDVPDAIHCWWKIPIPPDALFHRQLRVVADRGRVVGSSWFVLNGDGNALPGKDMRVMILQVTTLGSLSGKINVQVFPRAKGATSFSCPSNSLGPGHSNRSPTAIHAGVWTKRRSILTRMPCTTTGPA